MVDLAQQISGLEDIDAIEAMDYVARWMRDEAQREGKISAEILGEIGDEQAATKILSEIFPELSGPLKETLAADESQKGRIARNYLLFLAEEERYAPKVQEALDRPSCRGEPLSSLVIITGIIFLLSLEFEIEYENVNGERHVRWRFARKATPVEIVEKILGREK